MSPKKAGDKVNKREKKPLLKIHSDPWDRESGGSAGECRGVNEQLRAKALWREWIGPGAGMGARPVWALGAQAERPGLSHGTEAAASRRQDPLQTAFQARLVQRDEGADGNLYSDSQYRACTWTLPK